MKLRVLEVLASLRRAGAERVAVSLALGLDRDRFETEVVSLYDASPDDFGVDLEAGGVRARRLGKQRGFDPRMWPRLRRVAREFRPDVVHTHSYVLRYALACEAPHFAHTVHNLAEKEVDALGRLIQRFAFRRKVAAIAISNGVAVSIGRVYGSAPAAVIPNGVHLAPYGRDSNWRERNGFAPEELLVVSVARLEPQKNPLVLLDAFAAGLKDVPARLLLAGEGTLRSEAERRAEALGIAKRTHFLGLRKDIPELLGACDVFAMSSDWEGSPLAVIEAMASGLPVAATAVGGIPELVEDSTTGLLVPAGDAHALGRALARLAGDGELRRRFGQRARERARLFSVERMIADYAAFFERLAGRRG